MTPGSQDPQQPPLPGATKAMTMPGTTASSPAGSHAVPVRHEADRRLVLPAGRALCYSGYRDGQSPDRRIYPTHAQILQDLRLLLPQVTLLRLYDCSPHAERVLQVIEAEHLPLRVLLGGWLAAEVSNPGCPWGTQYGASTLEDNARWNEAEMARLVALANAHPQTVFAVAVGNEAAVDWTDHLVPVPRIAELAGHVRARVVQPVTVCDNHVPWLHGLRELANGLDFISLHTYPLWEGRTAADALALTQDNVRAVCEAHPGKPVVITEAGWATRANGRGFPPAHASEAAQRQHLRELLAWVDAQGILCFVFEAFDEAWKGADDPLEPEKHWGLFTADRQPKACARELFGVRG